MTYKYAFVYGIVCLTIVSCSAQELYEQSEPSEDLYCFQCNSQQDPECRNILANDTSSWAYRPCLDTEKYKDKKPFCRKIVQKIFPRHDMEVVIRKCGWVQHDRLDCYSMRNEDHVETSCQCFNSGCNGVEAVGASLVVVTLATLIASSSLMW